VNCDARLPDDHGDGFHICFRSSRHDGEHLCTCGVGWTATSNPVLLKALADLVLANQDDILASIRYSAMKYEHSKRPGVAKDLDQLAERLEKTIHAFGEQEAT
jgi:hypothetical protein